MLKSVAQWIRDLCGQGRLKEGSEEKETCLLKGEPEERQQEEEEEEEEEQQQEQHQHENQEGGAGRKAAEPCISCGGQGCGICKMTDSVRCKELLASVQSQPTRLCAFTPVKDEILDALFSCPHFQGRACTTTGVFYDLGSGDGRVVLDVAERYHGPLVGVEIDEELVEGSNRWLESRFQSDNDIRKRVTFLAEDFRFVSLADANMVFLFLPGHLCEFVFREVLAHSELPRGTLIYVCGRSSWEPSLLGTRNGQDPAQAFCTRVTAYNTGSDSFSTLHCFRWKS